MNKFYEKIILGVLLLIVIYNLVNYDILEGITQDGRKIPVLKKATILKLSY